jgi:hypothetical protein
MSLCAFVVVIGAISIFGAVRRGDEGAAAHIFQLLIVGEAPVVAFVTLRWLRKDLKASLTVMAIQALMLALALLPVWYFGL